MQRGLPVLSGHWFWSGGGSDCAKKPVEEKAVRTGTACLVLFDHAAPHLPIQGLSFRDKKTLATPALRSWRVGRGPFLRLPRPPQRPCPRARRFPPRLRGATASIGGSSSDARHIRRPVPTPCAPLYGFRRHTRLERRIMVPAFRHVRISLSLEISRLQIVASVTVRFSGGSSQRKIRTVPDEKIPEICTVEYDISLLARLQTH